MNSAIIVAGGVSKRFGGEVPKQFVHVNGKEILSFSVERFFSHTEIDEVVIVCNESWVGHVQKKYPHCKVVVGGETRQDSSLNGVNAVERKSEQVLIHDAARPLVSDNIISNCIKALDEGDGSVPVLNPVNSLIQLENNIATYVNRSIIKEVQTPQCFKKNLILDALSSELTGTDEIGIVLQATPRANIKFIEGEKNNFKITTEIDLQFLSTLTETWI